MLLVAAAVAFIVRRIFLKSRKSMDSLNCCTHFGYVLAFHIYHFRNFARTLLCVLYSLNCFRFHFDVCAMLCSLHSKNHTKAICNASQLQRSKDHILEYTYPLKSKNPNTYILSTICVQFSSKILFSLLHFMIFASQKRDFLLFPFWNGTFARCKERKKHEYFICTSICGSSEKFPLQKYEVNS